MVGAALMFGSWEAQPLEDDIAWWHWQKVHHWIRASKSKFPSAFLIKWYVVHRTSHIQ